MTTMHEDEQRMRMEQWQAAIADATLDKAAVNSLVMNLLIVEGFQSVAEQFQQEANIKGSVPLASITGRTSVRSAVSAGRIDDGLREINVMLPTLLENNPALLLQLQQQQLVELIRADKIDQALTFARTHLRSGCASEPAALQALEGIMSLLAFSALPPDHNPMAHLLDPRARVSLAGAVNDAILEGQFACKESQLQRVAKQTMHSQQQLANFMTDFPKLPVDHTAAASSAGATATAASATNRGTNSSAARDLLDPATLFESLAASEAAARKAAEEKAAAELALVISALEQERTAREERERNRRARQAAFAAARAAEPRAAPPVGLADEDDDDDEEEQRRAALAAAQQEEEDEEDDDDDDNEEEEEEEEEDANMATFV